MWIPVRLLTDAGACFIAAVVSFDVAEASYSLAEASCSLAEANYEVAEANYEAAEASCSLAEANCEVAVRNYDNAVCNYDKAGWSCRVAEGYNRYLSVFWWMHDPIFYVENLLEKHNNWNDLKGQADMQLHAYLCSLINNSVRHIYKLVA